jgi:hypothetical protein
LTEFEIVIAIPRERETDRRFRRLLLLRLSMPAQRRFEIGE